MSTYAHSDKTHLMITKDIHKIDNYLIRTGIGWIVLLALYGACSGGITNVMFSCAGDDQRIYDVRSEHGMQMFTSSETLEQVQERFPHSEVNVITHDDLESAYADINPIYLYAPWLLLFVGYLVRRQENKIVAIWNILERSGEISLTELRTNTGHTQDFLLKAVQIINRHSREPYHWDEPNNIIYNAWTAGQVFYIEQCMNCSASVGQQMRLSKLKPAKCPYCQHALISDAMIEEAAASKQKAAGSTSSDGSFTFDGRIPGGSTPVSPDKPFSPLIFIVLLLVASPLAIGYAVWKTGLIQRWQYDSIRNPALHANQQF
ncbi:MAG: hypothetical protein VX834_10200, partial [Myxococcota bacterium]|nr:hypothetical protein [Myxococcota bacterium]